MSNCVAFDALMKCFVKACLGCLMPDDRREFLSALSASASDLEQYAATVARDGDPGPFGPPLAPADLASVRRWVDEFADLLENRSGRSSTLR